MDAQARDRWGVEADDGSAETIAPRSARRRVDSARDGAGQRRRRCDEGKDARQEKGDEQGSAQRQRANAQPPPVPAGVRYTGT